MGAPVLVGAGIGAISSLAMGKDPLMGAAMGGLTGGAFGGSTGFGSGFTEGGLFDVGSGVLSSGASDVAKTATGDFMTSTMPYRAGMDYPTSLISNPMSASGPTISQAGEIVGPNMNFVGMSDVPTESLLTSTRPYQQGGLSVKAGEAPKTGFLNNAYESVANMSPMEQAQLGQMGIDAFTPEEQQMIQQQTGQIKPAKEVTAGTPLAINMPTRTFKPRFA